MDGTPEQQPSETTAASEQPDDTGAARDASGQTAENSPEKLKPENGNQSAPPAGPAREAESPLAPAPQVLPPGPPELPPPVPPAPPTPERLKINPDRPAKKGIKPEDERIRNERVHLRQTLAAGTGERCLEPMSSLAREVFPMDPDLVESWCVKLHSGRLLMLVSEDPDTLYSALQAVSQCPRFSQAEKFGVNFRTQPEISRALGDHCTAPRFVAAYVVPADADRWLKDVPKDGFVSKEFRSRLLASETWLLMLATPARLRTAQLESVLELDWVDPEVDFIRPRLSSYYGDGHEHIEKEFRRHVDANQLGSPAECLRKLNAAMARKEVRELLEELSLGEQGIPLRNKRAIPDWDALLTSGDLLTEMALFVATFFEGGSDEIEKSLRVESFDTAMNLLMPLAVADLEMPPSAGAPGAQPEDPERFLARAWAKQKSGVLQKCGLITTRSGSRPTVVGFQDPVWRSTLRTKFLDEQYWTLCRLCSYTRSPSFVFGPPDMANGAIKVAAAQICVSPGSGETAFIDWMFAAARKPSAARSQTANLPEQLSAAFEAMTEERRRGLAAWLSLLMRECIGQGQARDVEAGLGKFIELQLHELAASVLQRLWALATFEEECFRIAKRLLSEGAEQIKEKVYDQLRRAALSGGAAAMLTPWRREWLVRDRLDCGAPGTYAARLIFDCCSNSIIGLTTATPPSRLLRSRETKDKDIEDLVNWMWHPAVSKLLDEHLFYVLALPALWIVPKGLLRVIEDDSWPADAIFIEWFSGYSESPEEISSPSEEGSLLFRALAVLEWIAEDAPYAATRLGRALVSCLKPKELRALRSKLSAINVGIGRALQYLSSGAIPRSKERENAKNHLKGLRERIRLIHQSTARSAAVH
jgi:hypothetical protein